MKLAEIFLAEAPQTQPFVRSAFVHASASTRAQMLYASGLRLGENAGHFVFDLIWTAARFKGTSG